MGFLDKAKEQAEKLAKQGQDKLDEVQSKKQVDGLLRDLGAWYYASKTDRDGGKATTEIDRIVAELHVHEAEHGLLGGDGPKPPPSVVPPEPAVHAVPPAPAPGGVASVPPPPPPPPPPAPSLDPASGPSGSGSEAPLTPAPPSAFPPPTAPPEPEGPLAVDDR